MTFDPASDQRAFRDALGLYPTGVTVVTTASPEGPVGITANSFASVSLDPPLVLWSPAKASKRFSHFAEARHFAIHVIDANQQAICDGFARDKHAFGDLDWAPDETGTPIIAGPLARFDCTLDARHDAGDHLIIVGRVTRAVAREGQALLFASGRYTSLTG